jgi:putative ABC transport system substrate-binding protein
MKPRLSFHSASSKPLIFILAGAMVFCAQIHSQTKMYKIGILQMAASLDNAVQGFKDGMKELGFVEGKNVEYDYKIANGIMDNIIKYADYFANSDKDLIFGCSTPVTVVLKKATAKTAKPIPVVFTPVSDPIAAGIAQSWKSSGCNLTGISSGIVTDKQLAILKDILPSIKRVLVISKQGDQSSEAGLAKIVAEAKKLRIELVVERPVEAIDVLKMLDRTDFSKIDAIHIPPDTMVGNQTDKIYEKTKGYKIPIIVFSGDLLKAGGFYYYVSNYYYLGKQLSRQAEKILKKGVAPRDIPIEEPKEYFLGFNLKIAKEYGIKIPAKYLNKAEMVIK